MNQKGFAPIVLILIVVAVIAFGIVYYNNRVPYPSPLSVNTPKQLPTPTDSTKNMHCDKGCEEMPQVCQSIPPAVSNKTREFSILNLGFQYDLTWTNQPSTTKYVAISRATSPNGPWVKVNEDNIPLSLIGHFPYKDQNNFSDIWIRGSEHDLYYKLEALDGNQKVIKSYGILFVPKCQPANTTSTSSTSTIPIQSQYKKVISGQISYLVNDSLFSLRTATKRFLNSFNASDMTSYSADCGINKPKSYFQNLLSKYSLADEAIQYYFNYKGGLSGNGGYIVTVIPNKLGYKKLSEFQNDFNVCHAEKMYDYLYYPLILNDAYLVFDSSCGTSHPSQDGCNPIRNFLQPTIRLADNSGKTWPSVNTSRWLIYQNAKYNFSLSYPDYLKSSQSTTSNPFEASSAIENIRVEVIDKPLDVT